MELSPPNYALQCCFFDEPTFLYYTLAIKSIGEKIHVHHLQ
jgi:hypothetical protein